MGLWNRPGTMVQGAQGVPVAAMALSVGLLVGVPLLAHSRSPAANFQCLVGSSSRSCRRNALLVLEMCSRNLQITVPFSASRRSEGVDLLVALARLLGRDPAVHRGHQHVFVVAAVEDDDLAFGRHLLVDAPEVVVGASRRAWAPSSRRRARPMRWSGRIRRGWCRPCRRGVRALQHHQQLKRRSA